MSDDFAEGIKKWLTDDENSFTSAPIDPGDGPSTYWYAPDVRAVAERLIPKYYEMLGNSGVRIEYLFRLSRHRDKRNYPDL